VKLPAPWRLVQFPNLRHHEPWSITRNNQGAHILAYAHEPWSITRATGAELLAPSYWRRAPRKTAKGPLRIGSTGPAPMTLGRAPSATRPGPPQ